MQSRKTVIIGGGLAGLVSALQLAAQGVEVTVVEKKHYPFHKVCGEYISNEVIPYLHSLGVYPEALAPSVINKFLLSSPSGQTLHTRLDLGGFGISRYVLDHHLYQLAKLRGVIFRLQVSVTDVLWHHHGFTVLLSDGTHLQAPVVLGAYGKRSNLDRKLERPFFLERSPYLGVKYHLRAQVPRDTMALHNFEGGYAGVSSIEEGKVCFCYLTSRFHLKKYGSIQQMEEAVLHKNPHLRQVLTHSEHLYPQAEVINEISFAPKASVENHVLMCGDAAGMITPLCGNGMAMAIHSAKLAADQVQMFLHGHQTRQQMEQNYTRLWQKHFSQRVKTGRWVQQLFGQPVLSEMAINGLQYSPSLLTAIMRRTHGHPF